MPQGRLVNRRRQFGTMILSRLPIVSSRNHLLPKYGTLTQHSIQQGALEAVIVTERAGPVRVYSMHLSHLSAATRLPQVEALLDIHARAPSEGGAWCGGHPEPEAGWTEGEMPPMPADAILLGDFNFEWDAPEYDRIVGPRRREYGRLNRLTGFVDAWVAAGHREDEGATIPAGRRIDYCFVSADARASRAVVVDRRRRNRLRSLAALDGNRPVSRERRWQRGPQDGAAGWRRLSDQRKLQTRQDLGSITRREAGIWPSTTCA